MRAIGLCLLALVPVLGLSLSGQLDSAHAQTSTPSATAWLTPHRDPVHRLIAAATADDFAWRRLAHLTDTYGARPSGSENYDRAAAWVLEAMRADGLDDIRTEPVVVPRWIRGVEHAEIVDPPQHEVVMLGLGGTVATPPDGIEAEVLPVAGFDDLHARRADAKGRIVLFNVPYTNYSETVAYRTASARAAAQYGAVAALVRSVGPTGLRTAHTGSVQYASGVQAIPAASISVEDANRIARLTQPGRYVRMRLVTSGRYEADVPSVNVVGELRGREKPDEIVLLGGHLDSWDVGTGASDDGAGCIVTWEALRLMKKLGLRPRRTIRVVLFANEEHGLKGAAAYAERHRLSAEKHVFALESDSGVFAPAALGFTGSAEARATILQIGTLLDSLDLADIGPGGGGADIGPIAQLGNVPTMAYLGDAGRLFQIHHTAADTVERIAPEELSRAAAAIAAIAYVVAEMPGRLPQ